MSHNTNGGASKMPTAREQWEQNRNDPITKKLNDVLSRNSESSESDSNQLESAPSQQAEKDEHVEVLFGMSPKRVQSLNPALKGESK